ncbi:MAG: transcription termination factor NusA [Armatimonadota bacterium]
MNGDFVEALRAIEKEKEIPLEVLLETVESALVTAYKKNFAATGDIKVRVEMSRTGFVVHCQKTVVDEVTNEHAEISVADAAKMVPNVSVGDTIEVEVTPEDFGRIAAQTAKQVVMQRIREAEREQVFDEYSDKVGEVVTGIVQRREQRSVFVSIGKIEALLPSNEQVSTEPYRFNDRIKVYVLEVRKTPKGPQVIISRTHPSLIRRLFELEVPEIHDGVVTIQSVAREAGARSKIAVTSADEKVDPVGACVGPRGSRVQAVVNELYDEKIDIVRWHDDAVRFIAESLSPAKVISVEVNEETKSALALVPDNQLSLAIGKAGQNVRLAARLTGWRIDIRSEAQMARDALNAMMIEDEEPEAEETAPEETTVEETLAEESVAEELSEETPETEELESEEVSAEEPVVEETVTEELEAEEASETEESVAEETEEPETVESEDETP